MTEGAAAEVAGDRRRPVTPFTGTEAIARQANETLAIRERYRDAYWKRRDPIHEDRLLWRAQSFRHLVHLLPGQRILEIGAGEGLFTRQLARVTRGENPITALTFAAEVPVRDGASDGIERLAARDVASALEGREFDFVVAMDLLDRKHSAWFLQEVYALLRPGGQVVFYESNPWNPVLNMRRTAARLFGRRDPRRLLTRTRLYELMSEVGFIRVFAVFTDFVYSPLTRWMIWLLRNLSILLENAPGVRSLAGAILIHAQKPPREVVKPAVSLAEHRVLERAVSVVVPCHNEEMNVEPLVRRLLALYDAYIHEIVLVDDNSTDATASVIGRLAAADPRVTPVYRRPPNGVGRAIADGLRAASGQWVLSMDCDFQHLLPEIRDLFDRAADGHAVVVGSRFSRHSILLNYPFQKIVANRGFHVLAKLLFRGDFRDLTNNLKLLRRDVVERLDLREAGFAVNAETGLQPALMGYRVEEVPISWINRSPDMGVSSFRLAQVGGGYWRVLVRLWRQRRTWKQRGT